VNHNAFINHEGFEATYTSFTLWVLNAELCPLPSTTIINFMGKLIVEVGVSCRMFGLRGGETFCYGNVKIIKYLTKHSSFHTDIIF